MEIRSLTGPEILSAVDDLARLRIAVFAEWPYLYDGNPDYEAHYAREFLEAPDSVLVAALDDGRMVGAATASPMSAQKAELRQPFEQRGIDTERLFYFGESVLLPAYRGRGIGHAFFDGREAHASARGGTAATFAAVVRPPDHPAMPPGYLPLDAFWRKRGYEPVDGLIAKFPWKDHDEAAESPKPMQYWMRSLRL